MRFRTLFVPRFISASSRKKTRIRKFLLGPFLLLLVIMAQDIGLISAAWADDAAVSIDNFTFTSAILTVKAGTTVTWTNHDDIPHSIVDKNRKIFRSKVLDTGETFSFTFLQPGDYDYFCGLHPHMTARIVVVP
jgi:plastocyanin